MGNFCDLHQLGARLKESYSSIVFQDGIRLPEELKKYNSFDSDGKIIYHKYSFVSINRYGQSVYLPNFLIFVAAHFVEYYQELKKYYTFFNSIGLDGKKEAECENNEKVTEDYLKDKGLDSDDYELAKQFLFDPKWWYGGKSITRSSDYFHSPILYLAGLVAAAQGFVPTITKFLSDHPELVKLLRDRIKKNVMRRNLVFETEIISEFMEKSMSIILKKDINLDKMKDIKENKNTLGFVKCQIGKLASVSDNVTDERRLSDVNKSINWTYNNKQYYLFKEQTKDSAFIYINEINKAYQGVFYLEFDEDKYRMYKIEEDRMKPEQRIIFGTPGSGKSKKVEREVLPDDENLVFRTTFHPDTDYSSFVGCYKPHMKNDRIVYEFCSQVFTDAYVAAWNNLGNEDKYYLVIEEINRGNCAQIFGDLFQLLDRNNKGYSEYPIKADRDLAIFLQEGKDNNGLDVLVNKDGIKDGKLNLPPNLNIIATMNTSDQSLFPMDSAFKRRWDWEYVPIDYDNVDSAKFEITVGDETYNWHEFLRKINEKIKNATSSEDKQMGNFFIKHSVNEKDFCDKVMFYLWSEVGKDNYKTNDAIFKWRDEKDEDHEFSFNELYSSSELRNNLLKGFICFVKDESRKETKTIVAQDDSENNAE